MDPARVEEEDGEPPKKVGRREKLAPRRME